MTTKVEPNRILKAIDIIVNKRIDDLDLDKTVIATIEKPLNAEKDGSHRVTYNGGTFVAYSLDKRVYAPSTTVYVQIPQNDFSKKKIILSTASEYVTEEEENIISNLLSDYVPIGNNTLQLINSEYAEYGYGLNSYSSKIFNEQTQTYAPYQDSILLYDRSDETNSQYRINMNALSAYIQEASGILLQADFRTILDEVQQAQSGAEYGLIFDLVFNNKSFAYKTYGEFFDAISEKVGASMEASTGDKYTINMKYYKDQLEQALAEDYSGRIGAFRTLFTKYATYVKVFLDNRTEHFTSEELRLFNAYYYHLANMAITDLENQNEIKALYFEWFDKEIQEEVNPTKTISYTLNSSRMTGNPFYYIDFNSQYSISPIDKENFKYIDKIYFYCTGFVEDEEKWDWVDKNRLQMAERTENGIEYHGKDIWIKNISFFALKDIEETETDYRLRVEAPWGALFYSLDETETLLLKADFIYKNYINLNDEVNFYWFSKDSRIRSVRDNGYDALAGVGWRRINKENLFPEIQISANLNKAYQNEYLCVAVYSGGEDGIITLKSKTTLFNESQKREFSIISNLGTNFKFDIGTPTLTCLIDGKDSFFETSADNTKQDSQFRFYWTLYTSNGETISFNRTYEEIIEELDLANETSQRLALETEASALKDVEFPKGIYGNQITYPLAKINSDSGATFECHIYTTDNIQPVDDSDWYPIGVANLSLTNSNESVLSDYRVVIENGDQVFQYSESGVAPTIMSAVTPTDFRHTDAQEILPLSAHLYDPSGLEIDSGTYRVKWVYPVEDTLIIPGEDVTLANNPANNVAELFNGTNATFTIEDSFDYSKINNQIQCQITYGEKVYYKDSNLLFTKIGDNGTNGTDIVAKIIVDNDSNNILDKQLLTVYIGGDEPEWNIGTTPILKMVLYNRSTPLGEETFRGKVSWKVLGGTSNSYYFNFTDTTTSTCKIAIQEKDRDNLYHNQLIEASVQVRDTQQEYHAVFPICVVEGTQEQIDTIKESNIYVNSKKYLKQILYNNDGRTPIYNKNQGITIENIGSRETDWHALGGQYNDNTFASNTIIPYSLILEKDDVDGANNIIDYGLNTVYILPNDVYAGDSWDNNVTVDILVNQSPEEQEQYEIDISAAEAALEEAEQKYNLELATEQSRYDSKIQSINEARDKAFSNINGLSEEEWNQAFRDLANEIAQQKDEETTRHLQEIARINQEYQEALDEYEEAVDAAEEASNPYDANYITFRIPLYFSYNVYGLASVNAWDGNTIDINNDMGYILAPQMGAGIKHDDNTFSGVVMGREKLYDGHVDSEGKTTDEIDNLGLLGFSHGQRSFFLNSDDGSAIFGLPETHGTYNEQGDWIVNSSGELEQVTSYTEGRIEFHPGKTSQIGNWKIGSRTLYNVVSKEKDDDGDFYPSDKNKPKDGLVRSPKNRRTIDNGIAEASPNYPYPEYHYFDIDRENQGVIISALPAYISVKGRPLTVGNAYDFENKDIPNEEGRALLKTGDSIEVSLEPNDPSPFTIYKHFLQYKTDEDTGDYIYEDGEKIPQKWIRKPIAGINTNGDFYSGAMETGDTALNINWVPGFGWQADRNKYKGFQASIGNHNFVRIFKWNPGFINANGEQQDARIQTETVSDTVIDQDTGMRHGTQDNITTDEFKSGGLYLASGQYSEEYSTPLSLYGEQIALYAKDVYNENGLSPSSPMTKVSPTKLFMKQGVARLGRLFEIENIHRGNFLELKNEDGNNPYYKTSLGYFYDDTSTKFNGAQGQYLKIEYQNGVLQTLLGNIAGKLADGQVFGSALMIADSGSNAHNISLGYKSVYNGYVQKTALDLIHNDDRQQTILGLSDDIGRIYHNLEITNDDSNTTILGYRDSTQQHALVLDNNARDASFGYNYRNGNWINNWTASSSNSSNCSVQTGFESSSGIKNALTLERSDSLSSTELGFVGSSLKNLLVIKANGSNSQVSRLGYESGDVKQLLDLSWSGAQNHGIKLGFTPNDTLGESNGVGYWLKLGTTANGDSFALQSIFNDGSSVGLIGDTYADFALESNRGTNKRAIIRSHYYKDGIWLHTNFNNEKTAIKMGYSEGSSDSTGIDSGELEIQADKKIKLDITPDAVHKIEMIGSTKVTNINIDADNYIQLSGQNHDINLYTKKDTAHSAQIDIQGNIPGIDFMVYPHTLYMRNITGQSDGHNGLRLSSNTSPLILHSRANHVKLLAEDSLSLNDSYVDVSSGLLSLYNGTKINMTSKSFSLFADNEQKILFGTSSVYDGTGYTGLNYNMLIRADSHMALWATGPGSGTNGTVDVFANRLRLISNNVSGGNDVVARIAARNVAGDTYARLYADGRIVCTGNVECAGFGSDAKAAIRTIIGNVVDKDYLTGILNNVYQAKS